MSQPFGDGPGPDEQPLECCAACSAEMDPATERGFPVGSDASLCFRCAVARGGSWDEGQQRWVVEPSYADIGADVD